MENYNNQGDNNNRILIVDDEVGITTIYTLGLQDNGFKVDAFNDPIQILSDLKNTCDKKMKSLDNFLAKFVDDENGKLYASHLSDIPGIEPIR